MKMILLDGSEFTIEKINYRYDPKVKRDGYQIIIHSHNPQDDIKVLKEKFVKTNLRQVQVHYEDGNILHLNFTEVVNFDISFVRMPVTITIDLI